MACQVHSDSGRMLSMRMTSGTLATVRLMLAWVGRKCSRRLRLDRSNSRLRKCSSTTVRREPGPWASARTRSTSRLAGCSRQVSRRRASELTSVARSCLLSSVISTMRLASTGLSRLLSWNRFRRCRAKVLRSSRSAKSSPQARHASNCPSWKMSVISSWWPRRCSQLCRPTRNTGWSMGWCRSSCTCRSVTATPSSESRVRRTLPTIFSADSGLG